MTKTALLRKFDSKINSYNALLDSLREQYVKADTERKQRNIDKEIHIVLRQKLEWIHMKNDVMKLDSLD